MGEGAQLQSSLAHSKKDTTGSVQMLLPGARGVPQIPPPPPPQIVPQIQPVLHNMAQQVVNIANPSQILPGPMGVPVIQPSTQFASPGEYSAKFSDAMFGRLAVPGQQHILQPSNLGMGHSRKSDGYAGDMIVTDLNSFNMPLGQVAANPHQGLVLNTIGMPNSGVGTLGGIQDGDHSSVNAIAGAQTGVHPLIGMDTSEQASGTIGSQAHLDGGKKGTFLNSIFYIVVFPR